MRNEQMRKPPSARGAEPATAVPWACVTRAEETLRVLEGRWKIIILAHLFTHERWRFSELARAIAGISERMLAQQLRELTRDGLVERTVYAVVPPRVEYALTAHGKALCPALEALVTWALSTPLAADPTASDAALAALEPA
jgi:DNA-binding HxlR family transcriptional regulator